MALFGRIFWWYIYYFPHSFPSLLVSLQCSEYLRSRGKKLKRVLLLIDARHGFKQTDLQCFRDLVTMTYTDPDPEPEPEGEDDNTLVTNINKKKNNSGFHNDNISNNVSSGRGKMVSPSWKLQVVLTKCDLVERSELARRVHLMRDQLTGAFPFLKVTNMPLLMLSALENRGIVELHKDLASLVPPSASGNSTTGTTTTTTTTNAAHRVKNTVTNNVLGGKGSAK